MRHTIPASALSSSLSIELNQVTPFSMMLEIKMSRLRRDGKVSSSKVLRRWASASLQSPDQQMKTDIAAPRVLQRQRWGEAAIIAAGPAMSNGRGGL